jgi:hypothetical protein
MKSDGFAPCVIRDQQRQDRLNHCNKYIGLAVAQDESSPSYNGSSSADSALVATASVGGENEARRG